MDKKILSIIALLCVVVQGAWAQTVVNLTEDTGEDVGTAARWYVNMIANTTSTLTLDGSFTTFKVYDDGGKSSYYAPLKESCLIVTAPDGYRLQLSGNITISSWEKLFVYDGNSSQANTLINYECLNDNSGVKTTISTVVSSGTSMMIYFYSNNNQNQYDGLDLKVKVFSPNTEFTIGGIGDVSNGSIAGSVGGNSATQAKYGEAVTLTATPSSGYTLDNLSIVDENGNSVGVTMNLWTNTATFTMPASEVTVSPTMKLLTDLSVNMPADGSTKTMTIPVGVISLKVYDDGGPDDNYSNNCSGYIALTAPEGYLLQLSGSITSRHYYHYLDVYEGSNSEAKKLIDRGTCSDDGVTTAISTVMSTSQSMTLFFNTNGGNNYAGLDLTITLIDLNAKFAIGGIDNVTNGSIAATVGGVDATEAKWNDVVTLNVTPSSG